MGRGKSSKVGNSSGGKLYTSRTEPIKITRADGFSMDSYGEGNRNDKYGSYHVEHTDSVGGFYVDSGTVSGYKIGDTVTVEDGKMGKIIMAHIYPNGKIDYNVETQDRWSARPDRRNRSLETLDENNKRRRK